MNMYCTMGSACASVLIIALIGGVVAQPPEGGNPFIAGSQNSPITSPSISNVNGATSNGTPAPISEPSVEIQPGCSCKAGASTSNGTASRNGCGQWDIVSGSNAFTCFVQVLFLLSMSAIEQTAEGVCGGRPLGLPEVLPAVRLLRNLFAARCRTQIAAVNLASRDHQRSLMMPSASAVCLRLNCPRLQRCWQARPRYQATFRLFARPDCPTFPGQLSPVRQRLIY